MKITIKKYLRWTKTRVCKNCMLRAAKIGSSRCETCSADYHNKKQKDVNKQ